MVVLCIGAAFFALEVRTCPARVNTSLTQTPGDEMDFDLTEEQRMFQTDGA